MVPLLVLPWGTAPGAPTGGEGPASALPEATLGELTLTLQLQRKARAAYHRGRPAEALDYAREALDYTEEVLPAGHPDIATSLNDLAFLLAEQGRYREAEPFYRRALRIEEGARPEGHPAIARALSNLGTLYHAQGRYGRAEPLLKRALALFRAGRPEHHPDIATAMNNLAAVYVAQDRLGEAEPLYRKALAIRRADPQEPDGVAGGPLDDAAAVEQALRAQPNDGRPAVATSLNNLATLYHRQGRQADAERLLERAREIEESALPEGHPDRAGTLANLGNLYRERGRPAEAESLLERALTIHKAVHPARHPDIGALLSDLGALHLDRGEPGAAADRLGEAVAVFTAGPNRPEIPRRRATFHDHAEAALRAARRDGSHAAERQRAAFTSLQWPLQGAAGEALQASRARLSAADPDLDDLIRRRDRLLERHTAVGRALVRALGATGEQRSEERVGALRQRYGELSSAIEATKARIDERFPAYAELALPDPLPLREAQALLEPDEVLVTVLLGEPSIAMAVTADRHRAALLPAGEELLAQAGALRCQAATTDPDCGAGAGAGESRGATALGPAGRNRFDLDRAHRLYRKLLGPFAGLLADKRHLMVAPDGALLGFPFQLLVTAPPPSGVPETEGYRRAEWLIRDHALSVLPTVASLRALRGLERGGARAPDPFVGFGDPLVGGDQAARCEGAVAERAEDGAGTQRRASGTRPAALFRSGSRAGDGTAIADVRAVRRLNRLPDTRCEVKAVAERLGADGDARFLGGAATEARVKRLSRSGALADYRMVLFATHGLVAGEAGAAEPALVLTPPEEGTAEDDGLLTAGEVAGLRLNADWAVLSACNTASGAHPQAESLSGLAQAFFYAGSRSVLVSHWPVYSGATADLVSASVAELARGSVRQRAEALRRAMLSFLDPATHPDPEAAHPSRWAPFSLVGEGGR